MLKMYKELERAIARMNAETLPERLGLTMWVYDNE